MSRSFVKLFTNTFEVFKELKIDNYTSSIYLYLYSHKDKKNQCYHSVKTIGDAIFWNLNCSVHKRKIVTNSIKILEEKRLLKKINRKNTSNLYVIFDLPVLKQLDCEEIESEASVDDYFESEVFNKSQSESQIDIKKLKEEFHRAKTR